MAKSSIDVTGVSVNDILEMDINTIMQFNRSEMSKVVGRLVSAGNKRARNLMAKNVDTPALKRLEESGGMLSTKGKTLNELRTEFVRAKIFLGSETSSLKGYKTMRKKVIKGLKAKGVNVNEKNLDDVLKGYEKLKQLSPSVAEKNLKYRAMQNLSNATDGKTDFEELILKQQEELDALYESQEELVDEGISQFFEIDEEDEE